MIGIYKITSPSGRIYIGQSNNIERRFKQYEILDCKGQIKLYRSFLKYGVKGHIFEIIKECSVDFLNEIERYYQDYYNVLNGGLNCKLTKTSDKSGKLSEEIKLKISLSNKGKTFSKEHIDKLKRKIISEEHKQKLKLYRLGKKMSEETKEKIKNSNKGFKHSEESKLKMSISNKNVKKSKEHCIKIGLCKKGKKLSEEHKLKVSLNSKQSKKVLNTITLEVYNSIIEASLKNNINHRSLSYQLNYAKHNKTNLILLNNE